MTKRKNHKRKAKQLETKGEDARPHTAIPSLPLLRPMGEKKQKKQVSEHADGVASEWLGFAAAWPLDPSRPKRRGAIGGWARSRWGSVVSAPRDNHFFFFFFLFFFVVSGIQPNLPNPPWLISHTGETVS